jgi:copper transport protein
VKRLSLDRRRPSARVLVALAAFVAVCWVLPATAAAHADLIGATPTPNATLGEAPEAITISLTEPIDPDTAFIDLLDGSQVRVPGIGALDVAADGRVVRATVPDLAPGIYTVSYQVVSTVDGHATTGRFAFRIDPTGAAAPPTVPVTATSPSVDLLTIAARWIALVALLVATGSVIGWWNARGSGADVGPPPWGLIGGAAIVGALGVVAYLALAARPIARALGDELPPLWLDPAAAFGWSPFAIAMRVTIVTAVAAAVVSFLARRRAGIAGGLLGVGLAGMSVAGHAASLGGPAFGAIDWMHLLAVATWLGALPALLVLARRRGSGVTFGQAAAPLLRRHGRLALIAAPVVALTGLANSPLVLGSSRDLVASEYGNVVVAKAGLLAVALGIGAVNHFALRGRRRATALSLVAVELLVAMVAVSAAATMVTIQPASARQPILTAPPVNPAHLFGEVAGMRVHATVNPPAPGQQSIQVSLTDAASGLPVGEIEGVAAVLVPPDAGPDDATVVDLEPAETVPGLFGIGGSFTPTVGEWTLELVIDRRGGGEAMLAFDLPVARQAAAEPVPPPTTGIGVPGPIAAVWAVLPTGPLAWLPCLLALMFLAATWRSRPSSGRSIARTALAAVVVVAGIGAGSRALVDAANAPAGTGLDDPPPSLSAAEAARGEGIYLANCASCHGTDGDGDGPIVTEPASGSIRSAVREMSAGDLSYRIAYGVAGTPMPAFAGTLTQDERWALVAHLRTRWGEP